MTTQTLDDTSAMQLAIQASQSALDAGNMPYGATLLSSTGELLHVAANNQNTSGDFTGHAEMVLLREASMRLGRESLRGTTVFASGEPCAMCSGALYWAGVKRVVFAATQQDLADYGGGDTLAVTSRDVLERASRPVVVDGPLCRDEAVTVLRQQR
jgi:tRNA(Arg) A34 adenosine deaminase TadA